MPAIISSATSLSTISITWCTLYSHAPLQLKAIGLVNGERRTLIHTLQHLNPGTDCTKIYHTGLFS